MHAASIAPSVPTDENQKFTLVLRSKCLESKHVWTDNEWLKFRTEVSKLLQYTKVLFTRRSKHDGKVIIGFPDKKNKILAKVQLDNLEDFVVQEPSLMLPKLTIYNVPFNNPQDVDTMKRKR